MSRCKSDPVCILELHVSELFARPVVVISMAFSALDRSVLLLVLVVAVEVAAETFQFALLVYYL